jgi:hypothetical protein
MLELFSEVSMSTYVIFENETVLINVDAVSHVEIDHETKTASVWDGGSAIIQGSRKAYDFFTGKHNNRITVHHT